MASQLDVRTNTQVDSTTEGGLNRLRREGFSLCTPGKVIPSPDSIFTLQIKGYEHLLEHGLPKAFELKDLHKNSGRIGSAAVSIHVSTVVCIDP